MTDLHSVLSPRTSQHRWPTLHTVPERSTPEQQLTDSSPYPIRYSLLKPVNKVIGSTKTRNTSFLGYCIEFVRIMEQQGGSRRLVVGGGDIVLLFEKTKLRDETVDICAMVPVSESLRARTKNQNPRLLNIICHPNRNWLMKPEPRFAQVWRYSSAFYHFLPLLEWSYVRETEELKQNFTVICWCLR